VSLLRRVFLLSVLPLAAMRLHGDAVIVITPHPEEIRQEFSRGFAKWQAGQGVAAPDTVEWRDVGGSGEAQRFVESEFKSKPAGIGIDMFFGGGPEPFLGLSAKKLLLPFQPTPELAAAIPQKAQDAEVFDAGRTWYGACLSSFGILQNRRVQGLTGLPLVRRWEDLAQLQLRGWIGAGDPRNSGTMNNMFEAFLQAYGWERGWELLHAIGGNVRQFDRMSSSTAKECALGQVAYAFCIDYYGFIQMAAAGGTNLDMVVPEDFTAVSADGIAILVGAPHRRAAERFMEFVLGEAGQKLWFLPAGHPEGPVEHSIERLPIRPAIYDRHRAASRVHFNPFTYRQNFSYNARLARSRRDVVRSLFGIMVVDLHGELQAARKAVAAQGDPVELLRELGRMPLTEKEAADLAQGSWQNPETRQRTKLDWQRWAREKYRRLAGR
jgi:ABC-type Fe3+ transport system substrate-binding protein